MENKLIKISKYKNNMVESPFGENMKRQAFHSTKTLKEPTTTFEEIYVRVRPGRFNNDLTP